MKFAIDLSFETDHRSPDYLLLHEDAVLESGVESEYPLYVTNLNEVRLNYRTLKQDGANDERSKVIVVPPAKDVSFAIPLGLRDMTAGSSGAVLGRIQTDPLVYDGYQHGKPFFRTGYAVPGTRKAGPLQHTRVDHQPKDRETRLAC